jgi:predicted acyl esterase
MFAGSNYSFAQKVITVGDYQIEEIWITMKDGTKLAADK